MKLHLGIFSFVLAVALTAQADTTTTWSGTSDVAFSGTSTLHDWAGKVAAKPFKTVVTFDDAGNPSRIQGDVSVEAVKMDTAEPKRDENMHKAMKVDAHPLILATIDAPFSKIAQDGKKPAILPLRLSLLGRSQDLTATISHWNLKDDTATFDLDFDVSLDSSGIKVPSVLLVIRVGDTVKVHASVQLTRS